MRKKKILVPGQPYTTYAVSYQQVLQSTEKRLPSESESSLPIKSGTFVNTGGRDSYKYNRAPVVLTVLVSLAVLK